MFQNSAVYDMQCIVLPADFEKSFCHLATLPYTIVFREATHI